MIDKMAREFMGIVRHLLAQPEPRIKNDRLVVSRERLIEMLNKHPYLPAETKLLAWRALHWLDADKDHFTRRTYDENGKMVRVCVLDLTVYDKLCELREMDAD